MCLEPLILAAYVMTMNPYNHVKKTDLDAAAIEIQTCERGPGLDVKASTAGLYGLAFQYGLSKEVGGWTATLTPKAGGAYLDHHVREEQSQLNFELGGQVLLGRDRWRLGVEYWHVSNAHLGEKNGGIELLMLQLGWKF